MATVAATATVTAAAVALTKWPPPVDHLASQAEAETDTNAVPLYLQHVRSTVVARV